MHVFVLPLCCRDCYHLNFINAEAKTIFFFNGKVKLAELALDSCVVAWSRTAVFLLPVLSRTGHCLLLCIDLFCKVLFGLRFKHREPTSSCRACAAGPHCAEHQLSY